MKTRSILMSSFGALLILISISENALNSTDEVYVSNQPEYQIELMPVEIVATPLTPASYVSKNTTDFSYLKFNVSDHLAAETGNDEMPAEANFDYLKFNVSDFIETETEIGILPEISDFDYLKFDVNQYIANSYNDEELPATDFNYLKFDVTKYMLTDSVVEINELPEK